MHFYGFALAYVTKKQYLCREYVPNKKFLPI